MLTFRPSAIPIAPTLRDQVHDPEVIRHSLPPGKVRRRIAPPCTAVRTTETSYQFTGPATERRYTPIDQRIDRLLINMTIREQLPGPFTPRISID